MKLVPALLITAIAALLVIASLPGQAHAAELAQPPLSGRYVMGWQVSGQQGADDAVADNHRDILKIALLTLAGAGGAAAFFTLAYLVRRSIGFDLHLPPEDGEDKPGAAH